MKDRNNFFFRKQIICLGIALAAAALVTVTLMEARETRVQKKLAQEVFRFHVLANSDSETDQTLKMKVKEDVIAYMKEELPDAGSAEETSAWARAHLEEIESRAADTLRANGSEDTVTAKVVNSYFPDKTYGDLVFPKGNYDALRIEIGEAKGKNWWCVLYPNLCFLDAVHAVVPEEGKRELQQVLDEEEYEMVTVMSKFKIKWFFFDF